MRHFDFEPPPPPPPRKVIDHIENFYQPRGDLNQIQLPKRLALEVSTEVLPGTGLP